MRSSDERNGINDGNSIGKAAVKELPKKWAARYSPHRIIYGSAFAVAILSLITVVAVSHRSGDHLKEASRAVRQTREVVEKVESIAAQLSEVESSARSFAISGKQSHLSPFYTAVEAVPPQVEELKVLLRNDSLRLQSLSDIEPVIAKHLKVMKDMVELGDKNLFRRYGQRNLTDEGNKLMEQIRSAFTAMEKDERTLLSQEEAMVAAKADRVSLISLYGGIVACVLVLMCGACVLKAMQGRRGAEAKLERLLGSMPDALVIINAEGRIIGCNVQTEKLFGYSDRELLGERMALLVPERFRQSQRQHYASFFSQRGTRVPTTTTTEVFGLHRDGREFPIEVTTKPLLEKKGLVVTSAMRDITGRKEAEDQISKLNQELKERALELETANKELEAFSYSVSHDLRSPLQNIDNFSQILVEDYANRLDENGREYVARLRGSCQHMEDIINALLALSNMMRSELVVEHFDLSALANGVADDMKQKDPDRLVEWIISDGLTAEGDAQLLRVVLENLFGNAWKFTANRARARIEFGALPQSNGIRTYFVRDDGAGFDMSRASKLFTPFKRLHDQSEFRGTGIGLATVQRVIHRHRGKIWAEGAVDRGATFCFTLNGESGELNGNHHHTPNPN